MIDDHGVQCVIVDYAQLLRGRGSSRYEQITQTSIAIRHLATLRKVVTLMLCQLNREAMKRTGPFMPQASDIRDSGQIEQDADVIVCCCWPHRIDDKHARRLPILCAEESQQANQSGRGQVSVRPVEAGRFPAEAWPDARRRTVQRRRQSMAASPRTAELAPWELASCRAFRIRVRAARPVT